MTYGNTKVKSHTRISKNGQKHYVKEHSRKFEMGAALGEMFKGGTPKKATTSAMFATAWGISWYALSTVMSVGAAAIWAVMVVCLGVITWAVMTKADRKQTRRELRSRAATSLKRRLRLMTHRTVKAPQKKAPMRAKKATPVKKKTPNQQWGYMTCMSCLRTYNGAITKDRTCGQCKSLAQNKAALKKKAASFSTLKPSGDGTHCGLCSGKGILKMKSPFGPERPYDATLGKNTFRWCSQCGGAGTV